MTLSIPASCFAVKIIAENQFDIHVQENELTFDINFVYLCLCLYIIAFFCSSSDDSFAKISSLCGFSGPTNVL